MPALGLVDYGSDSDGDNDARPASPIGLKPPLSSTSALSLPPPSKSPKPSTTGTTKPKRPPKKITIGLPALPTGSDDDDKPPAKKTRLQSGAGSSSLFSILPLPKQTLPTQKPSAPTPPERVLGGGQRPGLVFNAPPPSLAVISPEKEPEPDKVKGDFFSLESTMSSTPASTVKPLISSTAPITISSAPKVKEFEPPEPTPTDPYPGYYLLPSGEWAAYDPEYYQLFYQKWHREYNAQLRALEKGAVKGFEDLERADAQEVDAQKEMEKAKREIQEREERKAVTHGAAGAPEAPKMNIKGAKLGARARSRHQLTTLLNEAYANRDALEEKIAEGRRNRKEAGNKYGF